MLEHLSCLTEGRDVNRFVWRTSAESCHSRRYAANHPAP